MGLKGGRGYDSYYGRNMIVFSETLIQALNWGAGTLKTMKKTSTDFCEMFCKLQ